MISLDRPESRHAGIPALEPPPLRSAIADFTAQKGRMTVKTECRFL